MELTKKECPACGQITVIRGEQGKCPACNSVVNASEPVLAPTVPAPLPMSQPLPQGVPMFPERMKANKALAGRNCSHCSQSVELGDNVWNCQTCQSTMHQTCRETAGGCLNPACPAQVRRAALGAAPVAATAVQAQPGVAMIACRFCGEKILPKARKCRHCGEFQSEAERSAQQRKQLSVDTDDNLTGAEIAFGVLCGGIACIMALVWIIQGKKKGWKLFGIAIASTAFWSVVRGLGNAK
ncbi:MAG TPA: hypothetical protein VGP72_02345 [Planctomycetota bacterium]